MKLHYFKDPLGNFGDDLNPWLWQQLVPDLLDDDAAELFVGIGTLLNHRLPPAPAVKHVFGSGLGYGDKPLLDGSFRFHAVRGFDTARALGLGNDRVITDGAVLLRAVATPPRHRAARFGFIPTGHSIACYDCVAMCRDLGWRYISCHWSVERVLAEMTGCETLICEAMHGAIAADALRIPWLPVNLYGTVLAFKWGDWLSTLALPYEPTSVAPLHDAERGRGAAARLKNAFKRGLADLGLAGSRFGPVPPRRSSPAEREQVLHALRAIEQKSPFLSGDAIIESHTRRFIDLIGGFRKARRSPAAAVQAAGT